MDIAFNYPLKHNSLKLTEIMKDHRFFKITNFFCLLFSVISKAKVCYCNG